MQLTNTFTVPVPVEAAWRTLLDVDRVAPCLPGASVDHIDGDDVNGQVKVKLGPIAITYKGTATFVERDEAGHRLVLAAAAQGGGGTAKATIAASMEPSGDDETTVTVVTDLFVTGKPAQFGRAVMADVSHRLVGQFADNLAREIHAHKGTAPANGQAADPSAAAVVVAAEPSLDLLGLLSGPAKRVSVPFLLGVAAGWLVCRLTARNVTCRH